MSKENEKQGDERRQRKERRKERVLPYLGVERRSTKIIREADVFEIYIPPIKGPAERRNITKRRPD